MMANVYYYAFSSPQYGGAFYSEQPHNAVHGRVGGDMGSVPTSSGKQEKEDNSKRAKDPRKDVVVVIAHSGRCHFGVVLSCISIIQVLSLFSIPSRHGADREGQPIAG